MHTEYQPLQLKPYKASYLFSLHGGVCGCREWWGLLPDNPPSQLKSSTMSLPTNDPTLPLHLRSQIPLRPPESSQHQTSYPPVSPVTGPNLPMPPSSDSSSTAEEPVRQTCFFWYHGGSCKRSINRTPCPFEHETRITWPIIPPPGYVHRTACHLPLCPLKEGMPRASDITSVTDSSAASTPTPSTPTSGASPGAARPGIAKISNSPLRSQSRNMQSHRLGQHSTSRQVPIAPTHRQICFFWYHHGNCRTRNGTECPYLHRLEPGVVEVNRPFCVRGHRDCDLPLCPFMKQAREWSYGILIDGAGEVGKRRGMKRGGAGDVEPRSESETLRMEMKKQERMERLRRLKARNLEKERMVKEGRVLGIGLLSKPLISSSMTGLSKFKWKKRKWDGDEDPLISLHGRREGLQGFKESEGETSGGDEDMELGEDSLKNWWLKGFPDAGDSEVKCANVEEIGSGAGDGSVEVEKKERADWDTDELRKVFGEI